MIGCIYNSPNSEAQNVNNLIELLKTKCSKNNSHLLILGDFNMKNIDWKLLKTCTSEQNIDNVFVEAVKDMFLT